MEPYRVRGLAIIGGLVAIGISLTAFLDAAGKDIACATRFFSAGGPQGGWIHARAIPWGLLYDYGELPGIVSAVGALVLYVGTRVGKVSKRYAQSCLVVVLTVIIGPGLLVNGLLKPCWGRPRPSDTVFFGGNQEYLRVWQPGGPGAGKSLPCGHCATAYSVASWVAFYPYHPALALAALFVGIAFGTLTGVARIAQGGHFVTDVLWSAIIVFVLIAFMYYFVFRVPGRST